MWLHFFLDIVNQKLVLNQSSGTRFDLAELFRESVLPLRFTLLDPNPTGGFTNRYNVVDVTPLGLWVGIGDTSIENDGTPLAFQADWTKDEDQNTFSGLLNLNTVPLVSLLDTATSDGVTKLFEVAILKDGGLIPVFQRAIRLKKNVLRPNVLEPEEVPRVSVFAQTLAQVLQGTNSVLVTQNGNKVILTSKLDPDGNLESTVNGTRVKPNVFAAKVHPHAIADVTGLQAVLDAKASSVNVHDPLTLGDVSPNIIPQMTSNTSVAGYVASASQELTPAWRAFDHVVNSIGLGWSANTPPAPDPECTCEPGHEQHIWLAVQFPAGIYVTSYDVIGANDPFRSPKSWYLEGSNDGLTWKILHTVTGQDDWTSNEKRRWEVEHDEEITYTRYRLKIIEGNGSSVIEIDEWQIENVCDTLEYRLQGQVLYLNGVRLAPAGGIVCGPGGLKLKRTPFEFKPGEGGTVHLDELPDIDEDDTYKYWTVVLKGTNPQERYTFNESTGEWELIGPPEGMWYVMRSSSPPNVVENPRYKDGFWINPLNPPVPNIWNQSIDDWQSICNICSVGGGYAGKLPNVEFNPISGTAIPIAELELSVPGFTSGVNIYYTLDGSTPTVASTLYSGPIEIDEATTVKAFATKEGWHQSDVSSASYGEANIDHWLVNINYREGGKYPEKIGAAATWNDQFNDFWNGVLRPENSNPGTVFKNADQSASPLIIRYAGWVEGPQPGRTPTFAYGITNNVDWMFRTFLKNQDTYNRAVSFYLYVPNGVYDLYVYGHGQDNASNSLFGCEDDLGARGNGATSTAGDWNNTIWTAGKQFILFDNLEPALTDRPGSHDDGAGNNIGVRKDTLLLIMHWNNGSGYISGLQLRKKNQLPKVRFTPVSGSNAPTLVQITCPGYPQAQIHFTIDGATPTSGSPLYGNPVVVDEPMTIKAIARLPGSSSGIADSAVNSATYV